MWGDAADVFNLGFNAICKRCWPPGDFDRDDLEEAIARESDSSEDAEASSSEEPTGPVA